MKLPYKLPTIVRSKNGDWFVKYFYEWPDRPGEFKEFRVRDGVNYEHNPEAKEVAIQQLCNDVKDDLELASYNPFKQIRAVKKQVVKKEQEFAITDAAPEQWTLEFGIKAFHKYCEWKKLAHDTLRTYKTHAKVFTDWLIETGRINMVAADFLETDYVEFADNNSDQDDWSPRTYNNYMRFMITLFDRMQILERKHEREHKKATLVNYKINLKDVEYKKDKAEKNRAYSGMVAERVKNELDKEQHVKLKQFIKFIYLSCMRPKEIRLLQIQHIDTRNRQIKVTGPTGKTGDRFVPISEELEQLLNEFDFRKLPLNYYLFGKGGDPGDVTFGRTHFSDRYKAIKSALGLDGDYTMYSWKHTRVIDLIGAGFKDEDIMKLTGHKDYQSFLAYRRDLVVNNEIMKGKTMGWTN